MGKDRRIRSKTLRKLKNYEIYIPVRFCNEKDSNSFAL